MVFLGTTLSAIDHARQSFYASGSAALLNVALNVLLIPIIGIEGAAVASLVSITLNAVLLWYYLRQHSGSIFLSAATSAPQATSSLVPS